MPISFLLSTEKAIIHEKIQKYTLNTLGLSHLLLRKSRLSDCQD